MEKINPSEIEATVSTPTPEKFSGTSGEMARKALIARQFRRMAASAQQPAPSQERLLLLVEDAYRLWREIQNAEIPGAVEEAIIEAGSFMPTAGLVAKCWKSTKEKLPVLGAGNPGREGTREYLDWLKKMDEEKAGPEFVAEFCEKVIENLEGKR